MNAEVEPPTRKRAPSTKGRRRRRKTKRIAILALGVIGIIAAGAAVFLYDRGPSADQHWATANEAINSQSWRAASISLRNVLQLRPQDGAAREALGKALLELGDGSGALKELDRAIALGFAERDDESYLRALFLQNRWDDVLERVNALDAPDAPRLVLGAKSALGLRDHDRANDLFQRALAADGEAFAARLGTIQIDAAHGNLQDALADAEALLLEHPEFEVRVFAARLSAQLKHYKKASEHYNAALELRPKDASVLFGLVAAMIDLKQYDGAKQRLDPYVAPTVTDPRAGYLGGLLAFRQKDHDTSQRLLREALALAPKHAPALTLLGLLHMRSNEPSAAAELLGQARSLSPNNLVVAKLLAQLKLDGGEPKEVIALLQPFMDGKLEDSELLVLMGQAHLRTGRSSEGNALLARAISGRPESSNMRELSAMLSFGSGRIQEGMNTLAQTFATGDLDADSTDRVTSVLVWAYGSQGRFEEAETLLDAAAQKHPDRVNNYTNLRGVLAEFKGDSAAALALFRKAAELGSPAGSLNLGRFAMRKGNFQEADAHYHDALQKRPDSANAHLGLALLAQRKNDLSGAIEHASAVTKAKPYSLAARRLLAGLYVQQREYPSALRVATEAVRLSNDHPRAYQLTAAIYQRMGRKLEAIEALDKAIARAPKSAFLHYQRGQLLLDVGDTQNSRDAFLVARQQAPKSPAPRIALATVALTQGEIEEALAEATALSESHGNLAPVWNLMGNVRYAQKDLTAAAQSYRKAFTIYESPTYLLRAVRAETARGASDQAFQLMNEWLTRTPDDGAILLERAMHHHTRGDDDAARKDYERVISLDAEASVALNNLAWIVAKDDVTKATVLAERAVNIDPANGAFQDTLGWFLVRQGKAARGLSHLQRAARALPDDTVVRYHLAVALKDTGDLQGAREQVNTLLERENLSNRTDVEHLHRLLTKI